MPTALPGMSITQARAAIQTQDRMIKQFPEVEHVFGKAGRAETPTDPAPLNMFETVVTLKPEDEWPPGMTWDKLLTEMDRTIRFPGMPNIWWMPIQTRTEMLATGIRSVLGVKVYGPDLTEIGRIAREIEGALATVPGTRSAFAERTTSGYYLDFTVKRDAVARYGMTVGDVQDVLESAIGGTLQHQRPLLPRPAKRSGQLEARPRGEPGRRADSPRPARRHRVLNLTTVDSRRGRSARRLRLR